MGLNEAQKKERSEYLEKNLIITECSQRKPYVFISYASDNWETVFQTAVVPMQKKYGLCVYADKAFDKVNDKWIVPMLRNIRGADAVIAFVSQSYIESYACFLELLTAVNNKKQIVFVSLGQQLHLGDTTDQPDVERGVKNEILNQGANIATNTNNTSNDIMRAMKSAYTSISTLLEQDALSKYDISDAFINFFRDASINRKTINDLGAVRGTIASVSKKVFDKSLVESAHTVKPAMPEQRQPERKVVPEQPQPIQQSAPGQYQPERQAVPEQPQPIQQSAPGQYQSERQAVLEQPQPIQQSAPGQYQAEQSAAPEPQAAAWANPLVQQPAPPSSKTENIPEKFKIGQNSKKFKAIVAAAGVCLLAIIGIIIGINASKNVKDMPYTAYPGATGTYTGKWKNDKPYKQGTIAWDNGNVYEGEWENGLPNGQGTLTWSNGDVYEGEWKDDYMDGQGTLTLSSGAVLYEGEWKGSYFSGQGIYTYDNGAVYEGEFEKGLRNGQGTLTLASGGTYTGEFKDDTYNGQGTFTWANGERYVGEWKDGHLSGQGIYTYVTGDVYEGEFEYSLRNGQGTMKYTNGDTYTGEWKDDQRNGYGTYTWADGTTRTGTWQDGNFVG